MPQIINTNIASLNAQRNLNASQRDQETSLQRLSSGLRINSAKDDAAGLAISTRFNSQISGTNVAIRNSGDAISLAQTAEGALDSINTSLQRVRELALQSANDTNTALDRQALQEEVDQLVSEIQSVADTSNFNGKNLLDGSFQNSVFQTGANVGNTVEVSIARLDTTTLGSAATSGISSSVASTDATGTQLQDNAAAGSDRALVAGDLIINGITVQASVASDDNSSRALAQSSAIAKAAAINDVSGQTGVTASVNSNTVLGTEVTTAAGLTGGTIDININGVAFNFDTADTTAGDATELSNELQKVADQVNSLQDLTGVTATLAETDAGFRVDLTAADGRNIDILDNGGAGTTAADAGIAAGAATNANVYIGNVTLVSGDGSEISLSSSTDDIDNAGFEEGTFSGTTAGVVGDNGTDGSRAALTAGDLLINGTNIGLTLAADDNASSAQGAASGIALAAAINRETDATGVSASVNDNVIYSGAVTAGASALTINGVALSINDTTGGTVGDTVTAIIDGVNAASGRTGVTAEALDGDQFRLVAEDGRNIITSASSANVSVTDDTYIAGVTLDAAGQIEIGSRTTNLARSGFTEGTFGGAESGTKLEDIDITSVQGATDAITAIDNAINTVAAQRAQLGAVQNRFESTISNLEIAGENLSAANSRIQDADFAAETAALSRSQVLQQAGISILAQANARPQQALSLLQ